MLMPEDVLKFLGTRSKWMVLYVLYKNGSMSGREISRQSGVSWMPVGSALSVLVDVGLLNCEPDGNKKIYSLNEQHFLYGSLIEFFSSLERCQYQLLSALRDRFKGWGEPILLNMGICNAERLVLVTKGSVSSKRVISANVARLLDEMGYRKMKVEIYSIYEIANDHRLRSSLDRTCIWVGGSIGKVKEILNSSEFDRRLAFFDF